MALPTALALDIHGAAQNTVPPPWANARPGICGKIGQRQVLLLLLEAQPMVEAERPFRPIDLADDGCFDLKKACRKKIDKKKESYFAAAVLVEDIDAVVRQL